MMIKLRNLFFKNLTVFVPAKQFVMLKIPYNQPTPSKSARARIILSKKTKQRKIFHGI